MAKLSILKGATGVLVRVFVQDSASTTGAGKTGLTAASFTGTKCYVARDDDGNAAGTAVTLTDATRGTWSSGGIKEKDATNMPGVYELGLTNASLATGSRSCTYYLGGTGVAPVLLEIELTGTDNQDAVHGGLTALPNTACTTNASLLTSGTGTDQVSVASGRVDVGKALGTAVTLDSNNVLNVSAKYLAGTALTGRDIGSSVLLSAGTGTGQLDFTSGVAKANAVQWLGGTIPAVNVTGVPLVDLKYTLGAASAGAAGYVGPDWGHVNAPTTAVALSGTTISTSQAVASVSGAVGSVTAGVTLAASQHVIVDSGTVTTLTNLPAITTDWLSAAGVSAAAVTKIQAGLSTYAGADTNGTTLLLGRLTTTRAGYLDNLSGGAVALASGVALTAAGLDAITVESGLNARQALSVVAAACAGVLTGAAGTTVTIAAAGVPATNRITATVDADNNRTAVSLSPPA